MRILAVCLIGLSAAAIAAPVPKSPSDEVKKKLTGRWVFNRGWTEPTLDPPEVPFVFPCGIGLAYEFCGDGKLMIRGEFDNSEPVIRQGSYRIAGRKIIHTELWSSETGTRTLIIRKLTADTLLLTHEDGMTQEFRKAKPRK